MTSVCVGGESWREACDTRHRAIGTPTRDTFGIVITMSAKAKETGGTGRYKVGPVGTKDRRKPARLPWRG